MEKVFWLLFLSLTCGVLSASSEESHLKKISITVPLADLAMTYNNGETTTLILNEPLKNGLAKDKDLDFILQITFPGRLYDPPIQLRPVKKEKCEFATAIGAAQAEFSAQKAEDDEWILDTFVQGDRPEIQRYLKNPQIRESNFRIIRASNVREVSGEILYKDFVILFIKDAPGAPGAKEGAALPYTYTKTPQGYRRSNALKNDEILDVLLPVLRNDKGEIVEVEPK